MFPLLSLSSPDSASYDAEPCSLTALAILTLSAFTAFVCKFDNLICREVSNGYRDVMKSGRICLTSSSVTGLYTILVTIEGWNRFATADLQHYTGAKVVSTMVIA